MQNTDYDVVIIGAGIQGAGVAQAAAANGYRTLVIEKFPRAGLGTSSKSSKLIHGGLRYLESGQLALVKECLEERRTLLKIAPRLVRLIPFYIPIYKNSQRPAWYIWLGLFIYSCLSLKTFSSIHKNLWTSFSNLKTAGLKKLYMYYDAQTDDTSLTQAVINSASEFGSKVSYESVFTGSDYINGKHVVRFERDGREQQISCRSIINCCGPWVKKTQSLIKPALTLPEVEFIAGTHIIIDAPPLKGAFYLQAKDNRAVFVIPWNDKVMIGTTERHYKGDTDKLQPTDSEIDYLLDTYNLYFESQVTHENISESFAGLRVLPGDSGDAFTRSRDSLILQHPRHPEIITLIGGKLTAYRASSEQVLKRLRKTLPTRTAYKSTRSIQLPAESQG